MTREEAINEWTFRSNHIKEWLDEYGEEPSIRHYVELIDMAIEALQAVAEQEAVPTVVRVTMSDGSQYYLEHERDAIQADSVSREEYNDLLRTKISFANATIPMFKESEEAYKAWTGEEMGKTSDEINEMNKEIIKDILKMMPTAYLLEALGVSTFEELTEQADRPHGEWIPHATYVGDKRYIEYSRCSECGEMALVRMNFCPNCGAKMRGERGE